MVPTTSTDLEPADLYTSAFASVTAAMVDAGRMFPTCSYRSAPIEPRDEVIAALAEGLDKVGDPMMARALRDWVDAHQAFVAALRELDAVSNGRWTVAPEDGSYVTALHDAIGRARASQRDLHVFAETVKHHLNTVVAAGARLHLASTPDIPVPM